MSMMPSRLVDWEAHSSLRVYGAERIRGSGTSQNNHPKSICRVRDAIRRFVQSYEHDESTPDLLVRLNFWLGRPVRQVGCAID